MLGSTGVVDMPTWIWRIYARIRSIKVDRAHIYWARTKNKPCIPKAAENY